MRIISYIFLILCIQILQCVNISMTEYKDSTEYEDTANVNGKTVKSILIMLVQKSNKPKDYLRQTLRKKSGDDVYPVNYYYVYPYYYPYYYTYAYPYYGYYPYTYAYPYYYVPG